jgi:hypothetical protein
LIVVSITQQFSQPYPYQNITKISQKYHKNITKISQKYHKNITKISQKYHNNITNELSPPFLSHINTHASIPTQSKTLPSIFHGVDVAVVVA